jgi:hypothetical protein
MSRTYGRACVLGLLLLLCAASPLLAQGIMHLDLASEGPTRQIPPPGSIWHELYPTFCLLHVQGDYDDNGDGVISVCDGFNLDDIPGTGWHIIWVGPTYHLVQVTGGDAYFEPEEFQPGNPVCQIWNQIWPEYGLQQHVDGWEDNGTGEVDVCDMIHFEGEPADVWWHVEEVSLNVIVETGPVSSRHSTWGEIKSLY